jgi:hypothetical protein
MQYAAVRPRSVFPACTFFWSVVQSLCFLNKFYSIWALGIYRFPVPVISFQVSHKMQRIQVEMYSTRMNHVRFEVFTAVTKKNGVFWDI